jgi:hypothetical protein
MTKDDMNKVMLRASIADAVAMKMQRGSELATAKQVARYLDMPLSVVYRQIEDMVNAEILVYSEATARRHDVTSRKLTMTSSMREVMRVTRA